jgi:hypothetical protein
VTAIRICAGLAAGLALVLTLFSTTPATQASSSPATQSGVSDAILTDHNIPIPEVQTWYISQSNRPGWSIGVYNGRVQTVDLRRHPNEKSGARWVLELIAWADPTHVKGIAKSWFSRYSNPAIGIWRIHWVPDQGKCLDVNSSHYLVLGACAQVIFGWSEENGPLWSFFGPTNKPRIGRPTNGPPLVVMPQLPSVEPSTKPYAGAPISNERFTSFFAGNI